MKLISSVTICLLLNSTLILANEKSVQVSFTNNSSNTLNCSIKMGKDYVPFINLRGEKSKSFQNFKLNSQVRCSISIDNRSSTVLTYFKAHISGEYELLLKKVKWDKGTKSKTRWATIVVYPNGEAHYNKLNHLK
ncbi:MAG: hypothetical protein KAI79_09570 [Bacteroidales bacterium]|nr:hypothetical protein [Bacteroidales bacterium]